MSVEENQKEKKEKGFKFCWHWFNLFVFVLCDWNSFLVLKKSNNNSKC